MGFVGCWVFGWSLVLVCVWEGDSRKPECVMGYQFEDGSVSPYGKEIRSSIVNGETDFL